MAPTLELTPTQAKALGLLFYACEADEPCRIGTKTARLRSRTSTAYMISHTMARRLVDHGFARYSRPAGLYLLITEAGRAVVGAHASAA